MTGPTNIERYFTRCEFDKTCDLCDNPENGTYAAGYSNDLPGEEPGQYVCGKCAAKQVENFTNQKEIV